MGQLCIVYVVVKANQDWIKSQADIILIAAGTCTLIITISVSVFLGLMVFRLLRKKLRAIHKKTRWAPAVAAPHRASGGSSMSRL